MNLRFTFPLSYAKHFGSDCKLSRRDDLVNVDMEVDDSCADDLLNSIDIEEILESCGYGHLADGLIYLDVR